MNWTALKSDLFLAKYTLIKPNVRRRLREVLHDQYLPQEDLEALHWQRLRRLLGHAWGHCPFYRRRFKEAGLCPEDVQGPKDFAAIPVLTRQDLAEHLDEIISEESSAKRLRLVTTGGTTGRPAKVYHQRDVVRMAHLWRMQSWWGLPPGIDVGRVYRLAPTLLNHWKNQVVFAPNRFLNLDASSISEASMDRFITRLNRAKPPLLHGYVGGMDHLATHVLNRGISVHPPKAVWVTSAPLTRVQEQRIQQAFHAPVYDQYGCCEVYYVSAECPRKSGLHVFHDSLRVDFLDEYGQPVPEGELGNIALTDFENLHFPLIRYLNGDRGRALPGQCECGVTLPLMDKVRGRRSDNLRTASGVCLSGEYVTTLFDHEPDAVRQFQVHQRPDYSITLRVVPNPGFAGLDRTLEEVRALLVQKTNHEVPVSVEKLDKIPHRAGKLHFVISEVTQSHARQLLQEK